MQISKVQGSFKGSSYPTSVTARYQWRALRAFDWKHRGKRRLRISLRNGFRVLYSTSSHRGSDSEAWRIWSPQIGDKPKNHESMTVVQNCRLNLKYSKCIPKFQSSADCWMGAWGWQGINGELGSLPVYQTKIIKNEMCLIACMPKQTVGGGLGMLLDGRDLWAVTGELGPLPTAVKYQTWVWSAGEHTPE